MRGGGTPGEAPSLRGQPPQPCTLCFPHRRSRVRRCPTQLTSKSFICSRLAPQCPGQGWEAGAKSHSTLSWGPPPIPVSASSCWPRLTTPAPFNSFHSTHVVWGEGMARLAHLPQPATLTPLHSGHPVLVYTPLCQRQLEIQIFLEAQGRLLVN